MMYINPKSASGLPEAVAAFDQLPDTALVNVQTVARLADVSPGSVWRHARAGLLAAPVKLGAGSTRWTVADVRRYLAAR
ncbi:MAG: transcriptional regulator [Thauera sp.]|jgi:predicted DNA-binding transcriptional regulator AlpA|nr:transcriptional regulator [Thauera sp.]